MTSTFSNYIREQLQITNTKVRKWLDWNPKSSEYEAFFDSRQVSIPKPECEWSFLVALHEIGHISTGPRLFAYLAEYNAEKWAINRAYKHYNIYCEDYVKDAKIYVYNHLLGDLMYSCLKVEKIKPYVLEWLETTPQQILEVIKQVMQSENISMRELSQSMQQTLQNHD